MLKKVTIKDIARMAGISPTTVSLVLNNKQIRISEATKQKIFELAEKYHYTPNLNARGLVANKTDMIGLVIPDIENPFFASLAKAIEMELKKYNYSLILINTNDLFENDYQGIALLNNRGVDAFLLVLSSEAYQNLAETKKLLENLAKPYVLVDRTFDHLVKANQVSFNNEQGQYIATKYLIEQGFKKIGYIAAPKYNYNGQARLRGYLKALEEAGLPINESIIKYGNFRFDSGYDLTADLVKQGVEAIVAANDVMAYGVIKKLNDLGLDVPNMMSVIGYDDLLYSGMKLISLTSVKQNEYLLGSEAVRVLMQALEDNTKIEEVVLEPELVIRTSVTSKN